MLVGDTLRWDIRETWYTPAHHLGFWANRLKRRENQAIDDADFVLEKEGPVKEPSQPPEQDYENFLIDWKGQEIIIRWCPEWLSGDTAHLEIQSADKKAHPISETGYRSHFIPRMQVDDVGGPLVYVRVWLEELDDGKPVQLSFF